MTRSSSAASTVKGKIVLARYGGGWRGLKPKLAQEHGAIGCLIYSDPADDSYAEADVYPKGGGRPEGGVQRGSVADMPTYPGDPLTPGVGATPDAKRLTRAAGSHHPQDPDAADLLPRRDQDLAALQGPLVTGKQRGGLGARLSLGRHRRGPGPPRGQVRLVAEARLRRDRDAPRQYASPTSGSSAAITTTAGCSAPPTR